MSARRFALDCALVVAVTLGAVCAVVGPPRLYGVGCDAYPMTAGFQLAREESDFAGRCRAIEPLPWSR